MACQNLYFSVFYANLKKDKDTTTIHSYRFVMGLRQ